MALSQWSTLWFGAPGFELVLFYTLALKSPLAFAVLGWKVHQAFPSDGAGGSDL